MTPLTLHDHAFNGQLDELINLLNRDRWIDDNLKPVSKNGRLIRLLKSIPRLFGFDLFKHIRVDRVVLCLTKHCFTHEVNLNQNSVTKIKTILDILKAKTHNKYLSDIDSCYRTIETLLHHPSKREFFFAAQLVPGIQDETPFASEKQLVDRILTRIEREVPGGLPKGEVRLSSGAAFVAMRAIAAQETQHIPTSALHNRYLNCHCRLKIYVKVPFNKLKQTDFGDYEVNLNPKNFFLDGTQVGKFPQKPIKVIVSKPQKDQNGDVTILVEDQQGHVRQDGSVEFSNGRKLNVEHLRAIGNHSILLSSPIETTTTISYKDLE